MAVTLKPLYPTIHEAKERRVELARYLRLDGGRRLIAAALWLALMSGLTLAQTGHLATQGHAVAQLQRQQTLLLREQSNLQLRMARSIARRHRAPRAPDEPSSDATGTGAVHHYRHNR